MYLILNYILTDFLGSCVRRIDICTCIRSTKRIDTVCLIFLLKPFVEIVDGSQICFQVAIGISGSIPECRPGVPGPGRDSDVTARGPDVVLANV